MPHLRTVPPRILLTGDPAGSARVLELAQSECWITSRCDDPTDTLRFLRRQLETDLVVVVPGFHMDPFLELGRAIKLDYRWGQVAVVYLLKTELEEHLPEIWAAGVDDCILGTASDRELLLRLNRAVQYRRATESLDDATAVIKSLAAAIEGKDHYTCGHVDRVAGYSVAIGRRMQLHPDDLQTLQIGGIVHDIGKIGIPDPILNKPGRLTDEEFEIIKRHPLIGHSILKPLRSFASVLPIVRWHHERPNGEGYPDGLSGAELPILPRIVAVADCFDALSSDRPYRKGLELDACRAILEAAAAKQELDADITQVLLTMLTSNPMLAAPPPGAVRAA